jgi:3-oxoacyl-[acyl-carrier protein] reductase
MKKAVVIGGSKGIGKAIANSFKKLGIKVTSTSTKTLDTSNIENIKQFIKRTKKVDYLVLNTGGPPPLNFFKITESDWVKYFNQLFLSFVLILQKIKINNNGYIFLISSHTIKNPQDNLVLSNSYRLALTSVLKTVSNLFVNRNITCINIAPGPIKTDRLKFLVKDMKQFERSLPMGRAGSVKEIANFVKAIIQYKIKYINGTTINFDGGLSKYIF